MTIEIRTMPQATEYRAASGGPGELTGYAAVFNRMSQNLGGFVEQVDPTAFSKSIGDAVPVLARYNHDDNYLLGTTEGGTLSLDADNIGLRYTVTLPDTSAGRDVAILAARGDLRYSSFAFETLDDDWDVTELGFPLRTLRSVRLVDVAPVNNPAYRDTTAGVRSLSARIGADASLLGADDIRALLLPPAPPVADEPPAGQVDNHPARRAQRLRLMLVGVN